MSWSKAVMGKSQYYLEMGGVELDEDGVINGRDSTWIPMR